MATYTKETALYDTGKIGTDITEAGQTASKYITAVDQNGIKVHAENGANINYSKIDANGLEVFKGTTTANSKSVAKFGSTVRIGKTDEAHIEQTSAGLDFIDSSGIIQASMTANNGTFELTDNVTAHKISLGAGMTIANGEGLEASFDSSGATIYEQGDPLVKMYRNNDGYGALAIGATEYASGQMDVNVEGYTGANYSLGQLVTLRSNGTEQHFAQFLGYGQDGQGSMALITAQGHNKTKAEIELDSQSANSNIKLDASTTSITGKLRASVETATPTITRTSGGTVSNIVYRRTGNVAMLAFSMAYDTSVAAGANAYVGLLEDGYRPITAARGCGYYGNHAIIGQINASGTVVIRNASSTAVTLASGGVGLTFTYIIA